MTVILDGKKVAADILKRLESQIREMGVRPRLAIVLCGTDPASVVYTRIKKKKAQEIGIDATIYHFSELISQENLSKEVQKLNVTADGIIVQLPLPSHIDPKEVIEQIDPQKDSDGLTSVNMGGVLTGKEKVVPATAKCILTLLGAYNIDVEGKDVTIINWSILIGKPLALMLANRGATVTICHTRTKNLHKHARSADILISAVGKHNFITNDMVKEDAIVIDVGTVKINNRIKGDVDFENVKNKTTFITPVPGGVGPMTVAGLLENVVEAKIKESNTLRWGDKND